MDHGFNIFISWRNIRFVASDESKKNKTLDFSHLFIFVHFHQPMSIRVLKNRSLGRCSWEVISISSEQKRHGRDSANVRSENCGSSASLAWTYQPENCTHTRLRVTLRWEIQKFKHLLEVVNWELLFIPKSVSVHSF